jgi:putative addiction module killer protein/probable addiction module antidote protein
VIEVRCTIEFLKWMGGLQDGRAKRAIAARIDRLATGNPGDVKPVGRGVSELRIRYGPGYRIYYVQRGTVLIVLLCGGDKSSQDADIAKAHVIAEDLEDWQMALKTLPYDSAEYVEDDQAIAEYLEEAMKIAMEDSDPSFLAQALGTVARARGMSQIAKEAGLSRESLYKALGAEGNPEFGTILRVIQALGLRLSIASSASGSAASGS